MQRRLIILAALATAACAPTVDRQPAEDAVRAFHARLDAGQFDAIYADASDDFKSAVERESFLALLAAVHRQLGATQSAHEKGWSLKFRMSSARLTLDYTTRFATGTATEQFVYRMKGDSTLLARYQIKSPALVVGH
jgi:hypothetical protein